MLNTIVELTAQRDQETLAEALVAAATSLTNANAVSVYCLSGELGHLSANVIAGNSPDDPVGSHVIPLESRPGFRACIESQRTVTVPVDMGYLMIHPVVEQGSVVGLLTRQHMSNYDLQGELAEGLVEIYANLQSLLNHQQRDGLTGLYNRSALQNWMSKSLNNEEHTKRHSDEDAPLGCFAMFDIDFFKRINDSKGHLYGDEVLLVFADLMRESFRYNDLLFRYGGEEFAAVLTNTTLEAAITVLERFRMMVAQHRFSLLNQVTVTIGVTQISSQSKPAKIIGQADKALYYGKHHGRNQVQAHEWIDKGLFVPGIGESSPNYRLF